VGGGTSEVREDDVGGGTSEVREDDVVRKCERAQRWRKRYS